MVVTKAKIVKELAGRSLLLPDLVAAALAANGRIKFALSWLQAAEASAGGQATGIHLEAERSLAGLGNEPLYAPPQSVVQRADGELIPGAGKIFERLLEDLRCMRNAIEAGAATAHLDLQQVDQFRRREQTFRD